MVNDLMQDVIDMHVHCYPDISERKTDDIELARSAAEAGMGGIIIKSHLGSSVERAYLVQQMVPDIRVFGGLSLNHPVGGLNPNAVDVYVQLGAKEVWMPTFSAQAMLDAKSKTDPNAIEKIPNEILPEEPFQEDKSHWKGENWPWSRNNSGISILNEKGKLFPEVGQILEIVAASETILSTGHLSIPETHALIEAAHEMGVERLLVTHPEYMMPMSTEDQIALAKKGVFFERCYICATKLSRFLGPNMSMDTLVNNIKSVGVSSTVLATDYGQPVNDHPVNGMMEFLEKLHKVGFSESEIGLMAVDNPRALLGI